MDAEEFIDALADGDSNDQEISGLWALARAAVALLTPEQTEQLNAQLPEMLEEARKATF
jgi:hypothetical protein